MYFFFLRMIIINVIIVSIHCRKLKIILFCRNDIICNILNISWYLLYMLIIIEIKEIWKISPPPSLPPPNFCSHLIQYIKQVLPHSVYFMRLMHRCLFKHHSLRLLGLKTKYAWNQPTVLRARVGVGDGGNHGFLFCVKVLSGYQELYISKTIKHHIDYIKQHNLFFFFN